MSAPARRPSRHDDAPHDRRLSRHSLPSTHGSSSGSPPPAAADKTVTVLFKTQLCCNYDPAVGHASCPYFMTCRFAHGVAELRAKADNVADGICDGRGLTAFRKRMAQRRKRDNARARKQLGTRDASSAAAAASTEPRGPECAPVAAAAPRATSLSADLRAPAVPSVADGAGPRPEFRVRRASRVTTASASTFAAAATPAAESFPDSLTQLAECGASTELGTAVCSAPVRRGHPSSALRHPRPQLSADAADRSLRRTYRHDPYGARPVRHGQQPAAATM